ncbi:MAG: lycopene cyclase domain-containing protein [Cyclobacteriaceae bacterium]|jgi:lycopene cyclase domain-containing protein
MKYLYLLLHVFTIAYPLAQSFESRLQYAKKWKALFPAIIITATFFIIWDVFFTQAGIWGFNREYLSGLFIVNLPIEEWLFFLTVPFASVFIYECVWYFLPKVDNPKWIFPAQFILGIILLIVALLHSEQTYTFYNFLFTGIFLLIVSYTKPLWLAKFWIGYFIHLIPFLLVNGVLTGAITPEPVVWYDNLEIMGPRIITIPIEDSMYALLLLLMNIFLYESFIKKFDLLRTTREKSS